MNNNKIRNTVKNKVNWKLIIALTVFFCLLVGGIVYKGTDHYVTKTEYCADIITQSGTNLTITSDYPIKLRNTRTGTVTVMTSKADGTINLYNCVEFRRYNKTYKVFIEGNFKK